MPKKITQAGVDYVLSRVKAKTIMRHTYPGRTDASIPLLYVDAAGTLVYGTAWSRPDKGEGIVLASRTQVRLGRERAREGYSKEEAQAAADAALQVAQPDDYVWVCVDPDAVAQHKGASVCKGSTEGIHAHAPHLKPVFPNPSRNAWCNGKGAEYKSSAAALAEADEPEEAPRTTPTEQHAAKMRAKVLREAARSGLTPAQVVAQMRERQSA